VIGKIVTLMVCFFNIASHWTGIFYDKLQCYIASERESIIFAV